MDGDNPSWLDWSDASRLAGFTGYAQLIAGRPVVAADQLDKGLSLLNADAEKQRSVLVLDLATAHSSSDAEVAASYAGQAFDVRERHRYSAAYDRIPQLVSALQGTPFFKELDERSRALPGYQVS